MTFFEAAKNWGRFLGLALGLAFGTGGARAEKWQRIKLYDGGNGEAGTYGDFNHDGKMDVAAGKWWWEGPAFTAKLINRLGVVDGQGQLKAVIVDGYGKAGDHL